MPQNANITVRHRIMHLHAARCNTTANTQPLAHKCTRCMYTPTRRHSITHSHKTAHHRNVHLNATRCSTSIHTQTHVKAQPRITAHHSQCHAMPSTHSRSSPHHTSTQQARSITSFHSPITRSNFHTFCARHRIMKYNAIPCQEHITTHHRSMKHHGNLAIQFHAKAHVPVYTHIITTITQYHFSSQLTHILQYSALEHEPFRGCALNRLGHIEIINAEYALRAFQHNRLCECATGGTIHISYERGLILAFVCITACVLGRYQLAHSYTGMHSNSLRVRTSRFVGVCATGAGHIE